MPSLTSLVAAVRESLPDLTMSDEEIADKVRTAKTPKGAVWIMKRAIGPGEPKETTIQGRWLTALSCLNKLAEIGDERAQAMLHVYVQSGGDGKEEQTH